MKTVNDFKLEGLYENICNEEEEIKLKDKFLCATLLYDIGYAPFLHTYEGYFKYKVVNEDGERINVDLINAIYSLEIEIV
jgi:hypothetical protein